MADSATGKPTVSWITQKYLKHAPSNRLYNHSLLKHKTWFYHGPEYLHGVKEIFMEEVYKQSLPPDCQVIDCGAHIGLSLIYVKSICPSAKIIAFEPDQKNFKLLQKNILSHHLTDIELRNEAVWIDDTELQFMSEGSMSSKITSGDTGNKKVKATRLKNYLDGPIEFLKLDIEGAEYPVIQDIASQLQNVNNLFIEYHGKFEQNNELIDILDIVNKADFSFYIKEATSVYNHPFLQNKHENPYDVQLNIFCFRQPATNI